MCLSCTCLAFLNDYFYYIVAQLLIQIASAVSLWRRSDWKLLKVEADHHFGVLENKHTCNTSEQHTLSCRPKLN